MAINLNEFISGDPDDLIDLKYTVMVKSAFPFPLALIECVVGKSMTVFLELIEETKFTKTYLYTFRGKRMYMYDLQDEITNWIKNHHVEEGFQETYLGALHTSSGESDDDLDVQPV